MPLHRSAASPSSSCFGRHFGRRVDVGVEAVRGAEPRVVDVAVDVVGEQRRGQREEEDEQGDRRPDRPAADPRRGPEDAEVGDEPGPDQDEGRPGADGQGLSSPPSIPTPPPDGSGAGGGGGAGGAYGSCPTPGA